MPTLPPDDLPGTNLQGGVVAAQTEQVNATLDECQAVVDHYVNAVQKIVDDCLSTCGSTWAECESCVTGKVNYILDHADAVALKCVGKLNDKAMQYFYQAHSYASPVIDKVPGLSEIVATNVLNSQPLPIQQQLPPIAITTPSAGMPTLGGSPTGPPTGENCNCWRIVGDRYRLMTDVNGVIYDAAPDSPGYPVSGGNPWPQLPHCPAGDYAPAGFCPKATGAPPQPPPINPLPPVGAPPAPPPPIPAPTPVPSPPVCTVPPRGCTDNGEVKIGDVIGVSDWNALLCPPDWTANPPDGVDGIQAKFCNLITSFGLWTASPFTNMIRHFSAEAANWWEDGFRTGTQNGVCKVSDSVVDWMFTSRPCNYLGIVEPVLARALLGFVEAYTHIGLTDLITTMDYTIQRYCPTLLPEQEGINRAFLGNRIGQDTWTCWTRAQNNLDVPAYAAMLTERLQPNHREYIHAYQRGLIDHKQLDGYLRQLGGLIPFETNLLTQLEQQLPGAGDIVRFMVRNTEDPNIVAPPPVGFGLDAEFEAKYNGILKAWAKGQGVSDEVMLRFWRAHWQIPAPSQLYEMLQRLRPDNNPALKVTVADVLRALGENDVLPFWRERLIAVAYKLPRLSSAKQLYYQDIWTKANLVDYYQSYGYNLQLAQQLADAVGKQVPQSVAVKLFDEDEWNTGQLQAWYRNQGYGQDDAGDMVTVAELKKQEASDKAARVVTKGKVQSSYAAGLIGRDEAIEGFEMAGLTTEEAGVAIEQSDYLRVIDLRKRLAKSIECQFKVCLLNQAESVQALVTHGWQSQDAQYLVSCWKQSCSAKGQAGKHASAAQLCKWWTQGLISDAEYRSSLAQLGYGKTDIARIISSCSIDASKKASKGSKSGSSSNGTVS